MQDAGTLQIFDIWFQVRTNVILPYMNQLKQKMSLLLWQSTTVSSEQVTMDANDAVLRGLNPTPKR